MFVRIVLVSTTVMFEYRFVMPSEVKVNCGSNGMSFRFWIKSLVFFMLKALGNGAIWLILFVNSLDSFWAGALRQFTLGRFSWSGLCIFISPLIEGAEGFMLVYFHLVSHGISLTFFYCLSDLGFEIFGWVSGGCVEVVIE